ncbi:MAG: glycosyltransferase family 4 protein [Thermodesulfobacteriota bacterium]
MKRLKVFITCSGLGNISRGYESFFRGCFDALCNEPSIDVLLYKGRGENKGKESCLWNIPRTSRTAAWLGKICGRSPYFTEQLTFFVSLLPHILFKPPDVVYVSDVVLANFIRIFKKCVNAKYRVLFNNNGPTLPQLLFRWDHIQQVSPQYLGEGLAAGVPQHRQTLLPSAVDIPESFRPARNVDQDNLRKRLGLPQDRRIILSVGAINRSRKRMDYVVREIAGLQKPLPFLLLLGQRESDTQEIVDLGNSLLSQEGFSARTVSKDEVRDYYRAADLFTLASLDEGFGLVYVEALSHGLPCLVHDYETSRFVLGEMGYYGDMTQDGGLKGLLSSLSAKDFDLKAKKSRHAYAYDRFSWDSLKPKYIELFQQCTEQAREAHIKHASRVCTDG